MGDEIYAGASLANDLALSQALEGMSRAPGMAIQQGLAIRDQQLKEEQAREWEMRQRRQEQRLVMDRLADASLASSGPEMAPLGGGGAPQAGGRAGSARAMQVQQAQAQAQQRPLWDYALGEQADQRQFLDVQAALADYDQQMAADAQTPYVGGPGPEEMMAAGGARSQAPAQDDIFAGGLDDYVTEGGMTRPKMGASVFEARAPGGTTISDPGYDVNPMVELGESAAKAMDPGLVEKYLMSQARPNAKFNAMNPADKQDFMRRYEDWWRRTQQTRRGDEVDAAGRAAEAGQAARLQKLDAYRAAFKASKKHAGNPELLEGAAQLAALFAEEDNEAALQVIGDAMGIDKQHVASAAANRQATVAENKFAADEENLGRKQGAAHDEAYRKEMEAALAGTPAVLEAWIAKGRPTSLRDMPLPSMEGPYPSRNQGGARLNQLMEEAHLRATAAGKTAADGVGRLADKTGAEATNRGSSVAAERLDFDRRKNDERREGKSLDQKVKITQGIVKELSNRYQEQLWREPELAEETLKLLNTETALLKGFRAGSADGGGGGSFDEADFAAQFEAAKGRAPSDAELAAARAKVTGG